MLARGAVSGAWSEVPMGLTPLCLGGERILICIGWGERLGPEKEDQANAMSMTSHCIVHP